MSEQPFRLKEGGLIDRSRPLGFDFDGSSYCGYAGDTLASALLANGIHLLGRSFKYHRPRGIFSAGPEEPNALVTLGDGARTEANQRATQVELFDGLQARSQNRWPSLRFDVQSINQWLSPFIAAGFYYKTFMAPQGAWMTYERFIRRAAGMGAASPLADPDRYDKQHLHCDLLIVGSGASGLSAALSAVPSGARILLLDEQPRPGGSLRWQETVINDTPGSDWVRQAVETLKTHDGFRLMTRCSAFGYYDHNLIAAVERLSDHLSAADRQGSRQKLWLIRAKKVILATGAIELPMLFNHNDRPGIMLAGAMQRYVGEYAVAPGRRLALYGNNDAMLRAAVAMKRRNLDVALIIDTRQAIGEHAATALDQVEIPLAQGAEICRAYGSTRLKAIAYQSHNQSRTQRIDCDALGVSGGWSPASHLHSQSGGRVIWDERWQYFRPGQSKQASRSVGAANGCFGLTDCLKEGWQHGQRAAAELGFRFTETRSPPVVGNPWIDTGPQAPLRASARQSQKAFVDLQTDVCQSDVELAHREGYVSVEHLKRYTTLGMGTDQGKTSNIAGLQLMASLTGRSVAETGLTTFRPPYTPVSLGVLAGPDRSSDFRPLRRTPMHHLHEQQQCTWIDAGLWKRPRYYGRDGESMAEACRREVLGTRSSVGMVDVTTLGRIDIQGPDAAELLNRVYINGFAQLPVGRVRYGIMLRMDGIIDDDGTTTRLADKHYLMTTTTAKAAHILSRLEFYHQCMWPELQLVITSVTDQWAGIALAGPKSRPLLENCTEEDISNAALPYMAYKSLKLFDLPARLFRISFSGELGYEINVASDYAAFVWQRLLQAGEPWGLIPYGMEALGTMRIEKGHVAGPELDGRTTPQDLGLGRMLSTKKDFIGRPLLQREGLLRGDRKQLVGFVPTDGISALKQGAQLIEIADAKPPVPMIGHISSTAFSPELNSPIALGLLVNGLERIGDSVYMAYPLKNLLVEVKVVDPCFIDPQGERLRA